MVDINIPEKRRLKISGEYYQRLTSWIDNKGLWDGLGDADADNMMQYFQRNARKYILAPAEKLKTYSDDFTLQYRTFKANYDSASKSDKSDTSFGLFIKRMREIYNGFMKTEYEKDKKYGYWLMKKLGVNVCPYCNRNYTTTIQSPEIKVRPEYDHFYPEALYPSLILSFYNLVPSCPQCNHLKKVQELDVNPWIGYRVGGRPKFRVDTSNGDFPARPEILIDGENENTKKLGIKELYNEHKDYVKDILNKIQAYNPVTYGAIKRDFQGIAHTEAELERMVWCNYTREEDMNRRPMAKLTVDIFEQYKKYL